MVPVIVRTQTNRPQIPKTALLENLWATSVLFELQLLSLHVFHTTISVSSLMAVAEAVIHLNSIAMGRIILLCVELSDILIVS